MKATKWVAASGLAACILLLGLHAISVRATEHERFFRKAQAAVHKLVSMDNPDHPPGLYIIGFEKRDSSAA